MAGCGNGGGVNVAWVVKKYLQVGLIFILGVNY
jgi:hypothetical protein